MYYTLTHYVVKKLIIFYVWYAQCVWKESNLRPRSYQERVLPLNYTRLIILPPRSANFPGFRQIKTNNFALFYQVLI